MSVIILSLPPSESLQCRQLAQGGEISRSPNNWSMSQAVWEDQVR